VGTLANEKKENLISMVYHSFMSKKDNIDTGKHDRYTRNPELIRTLIDKLNIDDSKMTNITITGSKGKGSICKVTSAILSEYGFKVGTMTSPHQIEHNERISINGANISDDDFIRIADLLAPVVYELDNNLSPTSYISPMGIWGSMALAYFNEQNTDINILECGRGGLHDDIAYIHSSYSAINTIFLEHTSCLGNTIEEVTHEKLGIIKDSTQKAFLGKQEEETPNQMFLNQCDDKHAAPSVFGKNFACENIHKLNQGFRFDISTDKTVYKSIEIPVLNQYSIYNVCLSVALCESLCEDLDASTINTALKKVSWTGYTELVSHNPAIIIDGCINKICAKYLSKIAGERNYGTIYSIVGIPDNKDYIGVSEELAKCADEVFLTQPSHTHLPYTELQNSYSNSVDYNCTYSPDFPALLNRILAKAQEDDLIIITGIQGLVGESRKLINKENN